MSLNDTPRGERLHIGIFGRRNSGKSSLINAICKREVSLVSDVAGTTTDPVYKTIEITELGACVIIDTAGYDDEGKLGELRVSKTEEAAKKTDVALLVISGEPDDADSKFYKLFRENKIPTVLISSKADVIPPKDTLFGEKAIAVSTKTSLGISEVIRELISKIPEDFDSPSLVSHLVSRGDSVLLVMPQDIQAPKGRLILPQVQTIRELLDLSCSVTCTTAENLENALSALSESPKLIITDSQIFPAVYEKKPKESRLTSFSVLFARYKGDIGEFLAGASAIEALSENSKVLIAEACAHTPKDGDIAREKLPRLLRKKAGAGLEIDISSGPKLPENLAEYDLIIHCGACMFNRRLVLSRIEEAKAANVPITNYGITFATLGGILDKIEV